MAGPQQALGDSVSTGRVPFRGESDADRLPRSIYPQLRKAQKDHYERKRELAAKHGLYYSGGLPAATPPEGFFDGDHWLSISEVHELMGSSPRQENYERQNKRYATVESFPCGCTQNVERYATYEGGTYRIVASPPRSDCLACSGSGRIRDRRLLRQAQTISAQEKNLLEQGGWHITKSGTTGNPAHRPPRGFLSEASIIKALAQGSTNEQWRDWAERDIASGNGNAHDALCVLLHLTPNLNVAAVAQMMGRTAQTIRNYRKRGKMLLEEMRQAAYEGAYEGAKQAIQEATPDIASETATQAAIAVHGHPADAAEKILEDAE